MGLKAMFKNMDEDNSGTITLKELKQGLVKQGTKISEYEVKQKPYVHNYRNYFVELVQLEIIMIKDLNHNFLN